MPTTKPKNKKAVVVKSGGNLFLKKPHKSKTKHESPGAKVEVKKKPIKNSPPRTKKGMVRIVEDENMLILTPQQAVEFADALRGCIVKVPETVKPLNLLSPEMYGWVVVESWPSLFVLYRRGIEYRADLSNELALLDARFTKGQQSTKDYDSIMKLQRGLFILLLSVEAKKGAFENQLLADFIDTLGARLHEVWFNDSKPSSQNQAVDLKSLFSKAVDGLMRLKFPEKAKGSGAKCAKERRAIAYAQKLCVVFGRHPTKSEVRNFMEKDGHGYAIGRGREIEKWKELFKRSGLDGLKD